jgi:2-dehydropantoate 2-reductase
MPSDADAATLVEAPMASRGAAALRTRLAVAARSEAFLLQGSDCAESFDDPGADAVQATFRVSRYRRAFDPRLNGSQDLDYRSTPSATRTEGEPKAMKICIVGAGAIGGFIGTRLAAAGSCEVNAVARGATLAALREHGWRMRLQGDALLRGPLAQASADARDLGAQDLVVVAVKGPALAAVARGITPLLGPDTVVLPAMNGVPWWFGQSVPALGDAPLESVDPGGHIAASIPLSHVVGCVVHASTSTPEPGVVQHKMGQGLVIGEPAGEVSPRVEQLARVLGDAGFDVTASDNVRYDAWYKLWGNMTMNPVSAITGATIDRVLADPLVRDFCSQAMREAAAVGERIGLHISETPEDRHQVTAKLGAFKSSMLQDVEAGRPIELDSLVAAVQEMGRRVGVQMPCIDALFGLARLFGRVHGLYPES